MKKILFMLFAAAAFVACNDDEITPDKCPICGENDATHFCQNVYFPNGNAISEVFVPTDTEFSVVVARETTDEAVEVPVKVECAMADCFVFPATVSFEAGEAMAEYVIGLTDKMEFFKEYNIQLTIGEGYADYYSKNENGAAIYAVSVQKSDWKVVGTGYMCSDWFGPDWYAQTLEKSEILGQYRLPNYYAAGHNVNFTWDGGSAIQMISESSVTYNGQTLPAYYAGPMSGTSIYMCAAPKGLYQDNTFMFATLGYAVGYGMQAQWGQFMNYMEVTQWAE